MSKRQREQWQQQLIRKIWEQNKAIELLSNRENVKDPDALTYEQVYEFSPAQGLDDRYGFPLQIAGSEFAVQLQASFGKFLHDLLGRRLGYLVRFEDFWEQWSEKGFEWAINRSGTPGMQTNYPFRDVMVDGREIPGWRVNKDTRPAYLPWTNPNKKANPYYRIIEYWPDRSKIGESYVLIGSDSQIIQHIVAIEYQGGNVVSRRFNYSSTDINRAKYPLIELWFKEFDKNTGFGKNQYRWRLRLIGNTVNSDTSNLQSWVQHEELTEAKITKISKNIARVFQLSQPALDQRFIFYRGKEAFVYKDNNGLFNKGYCLNENEAKKLISAFCEILEVDPDWTKLTIKKNSDEAKAFPEREEEVKVLGETVKKPIQRPKNKVIFWEATMSLPGIPAFPIVNLHGFVFTKLPDPLPTLQTV